jgi:hypothetical protein
VHGLDERVLGSEGAVRSGQRDVDGFGVESALAACASICALS